MGLGIVPRTRQENSDRITSWIKANPEKARANTRKWRLKNIERVREYSRKYAKINRAEKTANAKTARIRLRTQVIQAYGGKCACCGEVNEIFLAIDHINNDGAAERKRLYGRQAGSSSTRFYRLLRRQQYPNGYQVLCWNCNWAKHRGGCPHKTQSSLRWLWPVA